MSESFYRAGLNYPDDFQAEYIAFGDASSRLINGTIDGAWVMGGFPISSIIVACTNGCKLLTVDDDVIYELQKTFPWYTTCIIPAGTYPNQSSDIKTSAIKMLLFTTTDLDEETVYQLTKTLWEHIDELGEIQRNLKGLTPQKAVQDIAGLPLHDGAIRYYKEIGVLK